MNLKARLSRLRVFLFGPPEKPAGERIKEHLANLGFIALLAFAAFCFLLGLLYGGDSGRGYSMGSP